MRTVRSPAIAVCAVLIVACGEETLLGVDGGASVSPGQPTETETALEIEAGVYDMTARITAFDPVWGDLTDYRYLSRLVLPAPELMQPAFDNNLRTWWGIIGTFEDLRSVLPTGEEETAPRRRGYIIAGRPRGEVVLELVDAHSGRSVFTLVPIRAGREGPAIKFEGHFGTGGHISGPFSAELRPAS